MRDMRKHAHRQWADPQKQNDPSRQRNADGFCGVSRVCVGRVRLFENEMRSPVSDQGEIRKIVDVRVGNESAEWRRLCIFLAPAFKAVIFRFQLVPP